MYFNNKVWVINFVYKYKDFYEKEGDGDSENRSYEIAYYVGIAQPVVEDKDNDILYDGRYRERVRDILLERGFICDHFGKGPDDAYLKEPVYNFEMHHHLFLEANAGGFHSYYENVKDRLLKDEENAFGYHFRPEDFYLFMIAHEYKHFANGWTGVRSLADTDEFSR